MPIIRFRDNLIHYAHIPKCGGHSLEIYLQGINEVELGFFDWSYIDIPPKVPWNISSPQHIDGYSLLRLFPKEFFTTYFTIVRDPLERIKSAFLWQKYFLRKIELNLSIDDFIMNNLAINFNKLGWLDNHFYPQVLFLYPGVKYKLFKLENNGLFKAKEYIDELIFGKISIHSLPHYNATKSYGNDHDRLLNPISLRLIRKIYSNDFRLLQYDPPQIEGS